MNTLRPTLLALATMALFLAAALLYTLPRRPPDADKAKYDFLRTHRDCSVQLVELQEIEEDRMSFWIRYRGFASNTLRDTVYTYRQRQGNGWRLED